jgi:hypothetical protein
VVWGRQYFPFLALSQKERSKKKKSGWNGDMVNTISFVQANLQHSITASRALSRTVAVKGIAMALMQEPWIREGCIMGLNIPGNTLFCGSGTDRPRTCILARNMNIWMLPGFSFRDLVAVQIKCDEGEAERILVVCSAYLPFDSEDLPPTRDFEELVQYCEEKPPVSLWVAIPAVIVQFGGPQTAMIEEWPWWNF